MIDVYFWPTPNGFKINMFLEENDIPHKLVPVNIGAGEQFAPDFLAIAPNNRMPAIVDHDPADGGEPVSVFESGAILLYLAEKYGKNIPNDLRGRKTCLEWLFWQMGGLGPMLGQNHHFNNYAPEKIPYAIERYTKETERLYAVLNKRLQGRAFICGDAYTIADMACFPWTRIWENQHISIDPFPEVARWIEAIRARPATKQAYEKGRALNPDQPVVTEEAKKILFGQGADAVNR